jgi:hypothetical protein
MILGKPDLKTKSRYEHLISTSWEYTFRPPFPYRLCASLLVNGNEEVKSVVRDYRELNIKFGSLVSMYLNLAKEVSTLEFENKLLKQTLLEKENTE